MQLVQADYSNQIFVSQTIVDPSVQTIVDPSVVSINQGIVNQGIVNPSLITQRVVNHSIVTPLIVNQVESEVDTSYNNVSDVSHGSEDQGFVDDSATNETDYADSSSSSEKVWLNSN